MTESEQVGSAGLNGEGACNGGDDRSEELENLNDGIPFGFHC